MSGLAAVVGTARNHVTTARTWTDGVVGAWEAYAARHRSCQLFTDLHAEVTSARDDVRAVLRTVEDRLDDSGWVTEIGDRTRQWNRVASHVSDGGAAVAERRLQAVDSWKRGASAGYRRAIGPQRAALGDAEDAATDLGRACAGLETSGLAHFRAVRDLLVPLTTLPATFPEPLDLLTRPTFPVSPDGTGEAPVAPCATFTPHYGAADLQRTVGTPLDTARGDLEAADTALSTAVRNAFTDQARRPGPQYPDGDGVPYGARFAGGWPVAGSPAPPGAPPR